VKKIPVAIGPLGLQSSALTTWPPSNPSHARNGKLTSSGFEECSQNLTFRVGGAEVPN